MKQFEAVDSKYGAPMGRQHWGQLSNNQDIPRHIRLFKVNLDSGGYDEGGAYWGLAARGHQLWCAMADACEANGEEDYREFVRAGTRNGAAWKLGILSEWLKNPLTNIWRHRFKIEVQFAGNPLGAMHYIYEWGVMVPGVCFGSKNEAIDYLPEVIGKTNEDWL